MPTYEVIDPDSGGRLLLEGDSPPSEFEIEQIFAQRERLAADMQVPLQPRVDTTVGQAAAQGLAQGAFIGLADEITGNLVGGAAKVAGDPRPFTDIRDEVIDAEQANFQAAVRDRPAITAASGLVGGAVTAKPVMGVTGKLGAIARPALARAGINVAPKGIAAMTAQGATVGAAAGAGAAPGGQRLEGATIGAALGAGLGLTISGIPALASAGKNRLAPGLENRLRAIGEQSGLTPAQMESRLAALGPDAVFADVADVFRMTADVAATRLGPTASKVQSLIRRDEGQFGRLMEPIRRMLGGNDAAANTISELKNIRQTQASPLYERAFDQGLRPTNRLTDLLNRPETRKAWTRVKNIGRSDPDVDVAALGDADPSFRGWQAITEQLNSRVDSLKRGGNPDLKSAGTVGRLRQAILAELDEQSPNFQQARALWAGTKQADDMLDLGSKVLKTSPGEIKESVALMSEADKAFYRMGVGRAIEERLATANDTSDLARIFRNEAFREKVGIIFPDKSAADDFLATVRAESIKKRTSRGVGENSITAQRLAVEKQLKGAAIGPEDLSRAGIARRAMSGLGAPRERTIQGIGNLLISQDPADQQRLLQIMSGIGGRAPSGIARAIPGATTVGAGAAGIASQRRNR